MRASYRHAIRWIILNDDICWIAEYLEGAPLFMSVTACFVADLFGKEESQVLADLIAYRAKLIKGNVL